MGRLNNKADCKSFMTENDHSAVHRPAALRPTAQAAARCKKCMALRCVKAGLPAITPKQQKTVLRWDGFSLSDIFPVLTDFAAFLPLARICFGCGPDGTVLRFCLAVCTVCLALERL